MGIDRNGRKPKRMRTTAQRLKGRRKIVFQLPDGPPEPAAVKRSESKPANTTNTTPKTQKTGTKKAGPAKRPAKKKEA